MRPKDPLQINEVAIARPRGEQVVIRVASAGVCHSDLHLWEGGYTGPPGVFMKVEDRGVRFPLTPGHEVAGMVEEVGDAVTGFSRGDKVLVYPWIGEGSCRACRGGEENVCVAPRTLGIYQDGGYAERMLIPSGRNLVRLESDMDTDAAASLACSGLTAYTAVKKAAAKIGQTLVIVGAGGLGLMGVQIAKAVTNARIVVMDLDDAKLAEARRLGADAILNAAVGDPADYIRELTDGLGADAVIDFVNSSRTASASFNMLRRKGTLVLVGLFGGSLELNLPLVAIRAVTIAGAYTGTYADLVELVALARMGRIQSVVTRKFRLDEVNTALEELAAGKILGRAVINP